MNAAKVKRILAVTLILLGVIGISTRALSAKLVDHNAKAAEASAEMVSEKAAEHAKASARRAEEAESASADETLSDSSENRALYAAVELFDWEDVKPAGDDPDRKVFTIGGTCNEGHHHKYQIDCSGSDSNTIEFTYDISSRDPFQELTFNIGYDSEYDPGYGSVLVTLLDEYGVLLDKNTGMPLQVTMTKDSMDAEFTADISGSDFITLAIYSETDTSLDAPMFALLTDGITLWRAS